MAEEVVPPKVDTITVPEQQLTVSVEGIHVETKTEATNPPTVTTTMIAPPSVSVAPVVEATAPAPSPVTPSSPPVVILSQEAFVQSKIDDLRHASEQARAAMQAKHDADMGGMRELMIEREKSREALEVQKDQAVKVALDSLDKRLNEMNEFRAQIRDERTTFQTKEAFDASHSALIKSVDERFSTMTARMERMESETRQMGDRLELAASRRLDLLERRGATADGGSAAQKTLIATVATVLGIVSILLAIGSRFL